MGQNRLSRLATVSDDGRSLRDLADRNRLTGLATVLVGVSQLPIAFIAAESTGYDSLLFIVGASGWLLIGIGVNMLRGKEAFDDGWVDSERVEWLWTAVMFVIAVAVAAATVFLVISPDYIA
jgi:hypothetical protein